MQTKLDSLTSWTEIDESEALRWFTQAATGIAKEPETQKGKRFCNVHT